MRCLGWIEAVASSSDDVHHYEVQIREVDSFFSLYSSVLHETSIRHCWGQCLVLGRSGGYIWCWRCFWCQGDQLQEGHEAWTMDNVLKVAAQVADSTLAEKDVFECKGIKEIPILDAICPSQFLFPSLRALFGICN